jgi:hypothetical protein
MNHVITGGRVLWPSGRVHWPCRARRSGRKVVDGTSGVGYLEVVTDANESCVAHSGRPAGLLCSAERQAEFSVRDQSFRPPVDASGLAESPV